MQLLKFVSNLLQLNDQLCILFFLPHITKKIVTYSWLPIYILGAKMTVQ